MHQSVTTIRVRLTDVNDNTPEFTSSSYVSTVVLKDAEEGELLLTLTATDGDAGNNGLVSYRSVPLPVGAPPAGRTKTNGVQRELSRNSLI